MDGAAEKRRKVEKTQKLRYHHCQMFVDTLAPLEHYKKIEQVLTAWSNRHRDLTTDAKIKAAADDWKSAGKDITGGSGDLVQELMFAFGWRIVAEHAGKETRSIVLRQRDPSGTQFILTAKQPGGSDPDLDHFDARHIERFLGSHRGRQGVAVMAFQVEAGGAQRLLDTYSVVHPKLVAYNGVRSYSSDGMDYKVFEAYSYYLGSEADTGTVLRFIETSADGPCYLGAKAVDFEFDDVCQPSYFDHIVSNVQDRLSYMSTLRDTLEFSPKVDFNAGVVAAGEAQIESTVVGNSSDILSEDFTKVLADQSQVYIPINNAITPFGHVHLFLEELGQGVQHIAHRVPDLVSFIARANGIHKATGEGLTFKGLPRSYFGHLTTDSLEKAGVSAACAQALWDALVGAKLLSPSGIFHDLDVGVKDIAARLAPLLDGDFGAELAEHADAVSEAVSKSRYSNIYALLGDKMDYEKYLTVVRNGVLVDIQSGDILFQIFSKDILLHEKGDEGPFIETIQRICAVKTGADGQPGMIKPGCGGFGIRNFLALFLSIELDKALSIKAEGEATGNPLKVKLGKSMVEAYTQQLHESNPILTAIAEAMTAEGCARDGLAGAKTAEETKMHQAELDKWAAFKECQNQLLMKCSKKYNGILKEIRTANNGGA